MNKIVKQKDPLKKLFISAKKTITKIMNEENIQKIVKLRDILERNSFENLAIINESFGFLPSDNKQDELEKLEKIKLMESNVHNIQMILSAYNELIKSLDKLSKNPTTPLF